MQVVIGKAAVNVHQSSQMGWGLDGGGGLARSRADVREVGEEDRGPFGSGQGADRAQKVRRTTGLTERTENRMGRDCRTRTAATSASAAELTCPVCMSICRPSDMIACPPTA